MPKLTVKANQSELSRYAAEFFVSTANRAIDDGGRFTVSLSGGSTPKALYGLLASDEFADQIEWPKVFFFFGDERFVPADSSDSNFRMVNESLFRPLRVAEQNIFRWKTEFDNPDDAAADYETRIIDFFGLASGEFPIFDLMLLGLGDDGHTASLFPGTRALSVTDRIAVANCVEKLDAFRLTMTFPVINNSSVAAFLVSGESKADVLARIIDEQATDLPAAQVRPTSGDLHWLIDTSAASNLQST